MATQKGTQHYSRHANGLELMAMKVSEGEGQDVWGKLLYITVPQDKHVNTAL